MSNKVSITAREAVDNSVRIARDANDTSWYRKCLVFVRTCWDIPASAPTAQEAWRRAAKRHRWTGDVDDIPLGAPVFSIRPGAGPTDAGHVFIAGGYLNGKRLFRSNDLKTSGGVDAFHLDTLENKWGHKILGWTGDLNGYDLNLPPSRNAEKKSNANRHKD